MNPVISELDKHAVLLTVYFYGIRYAFLSRHEIGQERRQARLQESPQALRQHATRKAPFNPGFSASLIILVVIILPYLE